MRLNIVWYGLENLMEVLSSSLSRAQATTGGHNINGSVSIPHMNEITSVM